MVNNSMRCLLSMYDIQEHVYTLAEQISKDYKSETPIMVCVLKGSFMFFSDLIKAMKIPVLIDFIEVKSYVGMFSSGGVAISSPLSMSVTGKHIILVEDIVDTGLTLDKIKTHIRSFYPDSLRVCSLLARPNHTPIEYLGTTIEGFVVGYGLDYNDKFRDLKGIYLLNSIEK